MSDEAVVSQDIDNIALPWHAAGFSVIPIQPDGTKRPAVRWSDYMKVRANDTELERWWGGGSDYGVAVICGDISGNAEMLELELAAMDADSLVKIRNQCRTTDGLVELWDELSLTGYVEMSPSGGLHMIYRIADHEVPGNEKIAQAVDLKTLVETRGTGGYTIVAPTGGQCHTTGEPWTTVAGEPGRVHTITWAQRNAIHAAIRAALNQAPERLGPPASLAPGPALAPGAVLRPGDDFNERASWTDILGSAGWTVFSRRGQEVYWTRPGKDRRDGHSATTGRSNTGDRMYVFSSSADGLPTEEPLTKLFVYAHYQHGGDMRAAVRRLALDGYGSVTDWGGGDDIMNASVTTTVAVREAGTVESRGDVPLALFDPTEHDVGNANRLAEKAAGRFAYDHVSKRWMEFTDGLWAYDDSDGITLLAREVGYDIMAEGEAQLAAATDRTEQRAAKRHRDFGVQSLGDGKIRAMVRQYAVDRRAAVTPAMLDNCKGCLNVHNGMMDLDTLNLVPAAPAHKMTMQFNAAYEYGAEAPKFRQFMADLFPDEEARNYIQRALGYAILGEANQRAFFLLHGPSGTGKSTLIRLMTKLFGDFGHTASEETFQLNQSMTTTSLHELRKKRFVATSELPRDAGMNENLLKRITGGDAVTSRTLYQREQTWYPECVLFVATNHLPRISGDDDALWRRAKVIEMTQQFGVNGREDRKNIDDELLAEESSGILNWLLEGAKMYRDHGLDEPEALKAAAVKYRNDVDPVAAFLAEEMEDERMFRRPGAQVPVSALFSRYEDYCRRNRYQPMAVRRVHARMRALGFESTKSGGRRVWQDLEMPNRMDQFILGG